MNHLHSEGVVHGDLKAGNVLLKAELQPVATLDAADVGGVSPSTSLGGAGGHSAAAAGTSGPGCSNVAGGPFGWERCRVQASRQASAWVALQPKASCHVAGQALRLDGRTPRLSRVRCCGSTANLELLAVDASA